MMVMLCRGWKVVEMEARGVESDLQDLKERFSVSQVKRDMSPGNRVWGVTEAGESGLRLGNGEPVWCCWSMRLVKTEEELAGDEIREVVLGQYSEGLEGSA